MPVRLCFLMCACASLQLPLVCCNARSRHVRDEQVIVAFVREGLAQLQVEQSQLWLERVQGRGGSLEALECVEAIQFLEQLRAAGTVMDVVYLDPMFPAAKR